MEIELLTALTPYLLVTGAFITVLLKVSRFPQFFVRVFVFVLLGGSTAMTLLIHLKTIAGKVLIYMIGGFPPPIGISYVCDALSSTLAVLVSLLFLVLYPLLFVFRTSADEYFLALYLGLESGLLGILYTGDIFNMFVMMELMLVAAYGLIALSRRIDAYISVFRYMMVAGVGGVVFFTGAVLTYFATGTLNIGHLAAILEGVDTGYAGYSANSVTSFLMLSTLFFWGLMIDEALAPFHFWLPEAYSASHPVVASLLAGASEGVAYYALIRIFYTVVGGFPPTITYALKIFGTLTVLVGGVGMIYSRRLGVVVSYSVILDTGYIALALSLGASGVSVALLYIVGHMIVKPLLFTLAGWAREEVGSDDLEDLAGVFRTSRFFQVGLLAGAMSVVGIPPTILFIAKLQLYVNLLNTPALSILDVVALLAMLAGTGLSLASFIKVISTTVLSPQVSESSKPHPVLVAYVLVLAGLSVLLGVLYTLLLQYLIEPASSSLLSGRSLYIDRVLQVLFRGG